MDLFIRKHQISLIVTILMLGLGWIWFSADRSGMNTQRLSIPKQGFSAPDFSLNSLTGESMTLSDLRGRPVMVNFWASWCQPCRIEMPAIEAAYQQYQSQGFTVLAINATSQDDTNRAKEFIENLDLSFTVLLDPQGEVMSLYKVSALPTTFFIDAQGTIKEVVIGGPMAEALLTSRIEQLLPVK